MKNIHILPTDKPSRLWTNNLLQGKLELSKEVLKGSNTAQHIYITSDEKPKKGEWSVYLGLQKKYKVIEDIVGDEFPKIILTTDPTLIADGVQAIDDTFLEWFVNNPSCEGVEVEMYCCQEISKNYCDLRCGKQTYKIIIPQEESKQEYQSECICENSCRGFVNVKCKQIKKQETLEEAAEKYCLINNIPTDQMIVKNDKSCEFKTPVTMFIEGAKWQAERMYSEEDMREAFKANYTPFSATNIGDVEQDFQKWFEQFKKK
jgi:hypothetical protein